MTQKITKEYFEPILNQKVQIQFTDEKIFDFDLIEIKVSPFVESLKIEPFSLLFKGSTTYPIYQQGTYLVKSPKIGELSIFLNPRQPDERGIYYEAIFN